jgi:Protein of unknown function (DUF2800)
MKLRPVDLDELAKRERSHSIFSPSSSHMWMSCAGSLVPNALAGESDSFIAAEGTVAHSVGEEWLATGVRPLSRIGDKVWVGDDIDGFSIEITREMLDHVQSYVRWCNELPGDHYVEARIDISRLTPIPNQGGTSDHAACHWIEGEGGVLYVTDLKYGMEIIKAKKNPQLLLYALGRFFELDWIYNFKRIVLRIAQPRCDNFDTWEISRDELLMFAGEVVVRAQQAWRVGAPRTPSKKACQYCSEKEVCPARLVWLERLVAGRYDELSLEVTSEEMIAAVEDLHDPLGGDIFAVPAVESLSVADMGYILPHRGMLMAWFKAMHEQAEVIAIEHRHDVPNMKLVRKRGERVWTEKDEVVEREWVSMGLDKAKLFIHKIISVAQAEKELIAAGMRPKDREIFLSQLFEKRLGGPTLAPVTDKRTVYIDDMANRFDDLDEEEDPTDDL